MKPEAQRIAIAEACGWNKIHGSTHPVGVEGYSPTTGVLEHVPDYLNNLNAIRSAVMSKPKDWRQQFQEGLEYQARITKRLVCELEAAEWSQVFLVREGKWVDE